MNLEINLRELENEIHVVEIEGEIDVYTSPKVKETLGELIEQGHYNLIVNLEKVGYIDSTGLGVFIGGLKKVREHNGNILLIALNPRVKKVFDITGLNKIFMIYANEQEAVKSLA